MTNIDLTKDEEYWLGFLGNFGLTSDGEFMKGYMLDNEDGGGMKVYLTSKQLKEFSNCLLSIARKMQKVT